MKKIFKIVALLFLVAFLGAQSGCQTTSGKVTKNSVKQDMIISIQGKIKDLGATPLTEDDIKAKKYEGILNKKDKYIKALQEQLAELNTKKEKEEADAKAKKEKEEADAKAKKEKEEAISYISKKIEELGGKPLTKDDIKYEGEFSDDKYVKALQQQLKELKDQIAKDKADAEKKAAEEKKAIERTAAIENVKQEILFLGETPIPEFEFSTEDKYIAALREQIEEIKKIKKEEEQKVNEQIPEWYKDVPRGTETVMYSRGTADSADIDNSDMMAIENAKLKLAANLETRINTKTNISIKQAGIDNNETFKRETKRISSLVVKDVTVNSYSVYKRDTLSLNNGKWRTFVILEFPVALAYKKYLNALENDPEIQKAMTKFKETEAFKELERYVAEFTGA